MYAIIRTGGKQYKVQAGDVLQVEKLDQKLGAEFSITDVLMVGGDTPVLGQPLVKGASVAVVVTKQAKSRKVLIFKKKRRQGYRRLKAHRQEFTELFVKSVTGADGKVTKAETTPNVVDVAAKRVERILTKQAARTERIESQIGQGRANKAKAMSEAVVAKKTAKKAAAKKTAKKATKKPTAKKTAKKKVVKKASKK